MFSVQETAAIHRDNDNCEINHSPRHTHTHALKYIYRHTQRHRQAICIKAHTFFTVFQSRCNRKLSHFGETTKKAYQTIKPL